MACLSQPELSLEQWHREAASSEYRQVTRGWGETGVCRGSFEQMRTAQESWGGGEVY